MSSVPYNGESLPDRPPLSCLSDNQLHLLNVLSEVCGDSKGSRDAEVERKYGTPGISRSDDGIKVNQRIDTELKDKFANRKQNDMQIFRRSLPCYRKRPEILRKISENQVLVISGETGCGKTTQVPQYILEEAAMAGQASLVSVVCTQPRRVAAISVAGRVAAEMEDSEHRTVGYQVRLDSKTPRKQGSILYCTTGVLLQKLKSDSKLGQFTHIIIDEIHERDVMADLLLVLIRNILPLRPQLKLILMSATLNASKFSSYMGDCQTLHVPGFMFPVEKHYLEDIFDLTEWEAEEAVEDEESQQQNRIPEEVVAKIVEKKKLSPRAARNLLSYDTENINLDLVSSLVKFIHREKPRGAILVFLPGWDEISSLIEILSYDLTDVLLLPLHSSMSPHDQRKIFEKSDGRRKIVVATNIAESSVTINDIVYVVDSGKGRFQKYSIS